MSRKAFLVDHQVARREAVLITNDAAADYDIASRVAVFIGLGRA